MPRVPERRSAARLVQSLPVSIRHPGFRSDCRLLNLSAGGILCRTDRSIAPMTKIELVLEVPPVDAAMKQRAMRIEGVVVRNEMVGEEYRLAVFFTGISKANRTHLARYIETKLKG